MSLPTSALTRSNISLNSNNESLEGLPIIFRTSSEMCSGATFICPDTCPLEMSSLRYSSPCSLSARIRSYLIPDAMKTFFTPLTAEILLRRSICLEWSGLSALQMPGYMHLLSLHGPDLCFLKHSKPYMLAVGPPTSRMTPSNFGFDARRSTSLMMDSSLLDTTVRPCMTAMAQKLHSP